MLNQNNLPTGIKKLPLKKWRNRHQNFHLNLTPGASFQLVLPTQRNSKIEKYKATTKNFQWLIRYAIRKDISLRPLGAGWSFSKVAATKGGLIDTKGLYMTFPLRKEHLDNEYLEQGKDATTLTFAQCGATIKQLHEQLKRKGQAMKTAGAAVGQTIAGALSTGTHGAAFRFGALPETVVGLHIVTGPDKHVFLQRASRPIITEKFTKWIGRAELISDDQLFNAALVSFGSFGFIHGVLLETEPVYLLEDYKNRVQYDDNFREALTTQDFSKLTLPYPEGHENKELYHFEVTVNPHDFEFNEKEKGPYLRVLYKNPYRENYNKDRHKKAKYTYGDDALGLVQTALDKLWWFRAKIVPRLINKIFPLAFAENYSHQPLWGTIGETFSSTGSRGKAASTSMAVDIKDITKVVDAFLELNKKTPLPGAFELRFVRGTKALLGFTRFPKTCVIELAGLESRATRAFYERAWNKLEELGIPFTLHWGKINDFLTEKRLIQMYGKDRVYQWLECRGRLLDSQTQKVFNNKFLQQVGLDKTVIIFVKPIQA